MRPSFPHKVIHRTREPEADDVRVIDKRARTERLDSGLVDEAQTQGRPATNFSHQTARRGSRTDLHGPNDERPRWGDAFRS